VYKLLSLRRGDGIDDGLVFCKRSGFRLLKNYVSKKFKSAVRDAELSEKLHFHSLRHYAESRTMPSSRVDPMFLGQSPLVYSA